MSDVASGHSSEKLRTRADLGPGSGKPCLLIMSPGFRKAGLYPSKVKKGFMTVGCLLSDQAPQDQVRTMPVLWELRQ